jgi:cell division protein FtsB
LKVLIRLKLVLLITFALAFGSIGYLLLTTGATDKKAGLQAELDQILEENRRLKEEIRKLSLEVGALKTRRDYLEKVARDELGLVKKGEWIFQLPVQPDGGSSDPGSE